LQFGALSSREKHAFYLEHDLFGKPAPTFPDHALDENARRETGHFSFIDLRRG